MSATPQQQQPSLQPIAEEFGFYGSAQGPVTLTAANVAFAKTGVQYVATTGGAGVVVVGGGGSLTSSVSSSSSLSPNRPLQINPQQQYQMTPGSQLFSPQPTVAVYLSTGNNNNSSNGQNSYSIGSVSSICSSLEFEESAEHADSYPDSNSDRLSHMSIKERRQCK